VDETGEVIAVAGSHLIRYDTGLKSIFLSFGVGRQRKKWQHFMADIKAWGKSQGCTLFESSLREGWCRIFPDLKHTHDFVQQVL
jgi:hypothetical protein